MKFATIWLITSVCLLTAPYRACAQSNAGETLQMPGQPADRVVKLPAGSVVIPDEQKCNKKKFSKVRKLTKLKIKCYGSIEFNQNTYLMVTNWLISDDRPGPFQLVRVTESGETSPLGDISAVASGGVQATQNNGNLEILSISVVGKYDSQKGWPYLRYRLADNSLQSVPMRMFSAQTNPIAINREAFRKARSDALQAQAAQTALDEEKLAIREERLAASQAYSTSYSRRGISIGHNFAPRGRAGCFQLPDLTAKLDKVVNEMEIYNNSNWLFRKGCKYVELEDPETYQKVGWYNNGKFYISIVFVRTHDGREFWKPVEVIANKLAGNNRCFSTYVQRSEGGITIRLYGRDSAGIMSECMNDYPFLGRKIG